MVVEIVNGADVELVLFAADRVGGLVKKFAADGELLGGRRSRNSQPTNQ